VATGRALVDDAGELAHERAQQAVHDEGCRVLDPDRRLASARPVANAVASADSSVASPGMISSRGMTATGLKKWKPTTRSGCSRSARHLGDRQRGGVRREHALGGDDRLDLGEHLLLDRHLLEDRLDDEVGVGEAVLGGRAGDQAREADALSGDTGLLSFSDAISACT
jgi:hypothetical protein